MNELHVRHPEVQDPEGIPEQAPRTFPPKNDDHVESLVMAVASEKERSGWRAKSSGRTGEMYIIVRDRHTGEVFPCDGERVRHIAQ